MAGTLLLVPDFFVHVLVSNIHNARFRMLASNLPFRTSCWPQRRLPGYLTVEWFLESSHLKKTIPRASKNNRQECAPMRSLKFGLPALILCSAVFPINCSWTLIWSGFRREEEKKPQTVVDAYYQRKQTVSQKRRNAASIWEQKEAGGRRLILFSGFERKSLITYFV